MDLKESSNLQLKDRRDQSTRIFREMAKITKNHSNVRKQVMKNIRANSKDLSQELNKQIEKQTKYLEVINKDIKRKRRQQLKSNRDNIKVQV